MNKIIIFISIVVSIVLINLGRSIKAQGDNLKIENAQLQANNLNMKHKIKDKES